MNRDGNDRRARIQCAQSPDGLTKAEETAVQLTHCILRFPGCFMCILHAPVLTLVMGDLRGRYKAIRKLISASGAFTEPMPSRKKVCIYKPYINPSLPKTLQVCGFGFGDLGGPLGTDVG